MLTCYVIVKKDEDLVNFDPCKGQHILYPYLDDVFHAYENMELKIQDFSILEIEFVNRIDILNSIMSSYMGNTVTKHTVNIVKVIDIKKVNFV